MIATDHTLRSHLTLLKDSFYDSLQDDDALLSFSTSWKSFNELYSQSSHKLHGETITMVRSFAGVVNAMATALLEGELASAKIYEDLDKEIARLASVDFKELTIDSDSASRRYIEPCCTWLLAHLHNPYPSKNTRARFAQESSTAVKDIDAWFVDARKRIGWIELRKAYFETRADMVRAATRHFKPTARSSRPSTSNLEEDERSYDYEFVEMQSRAYSLFAPKFFPTALATNITSQADKTSRAETVPPYPSSERSISHTPTPAPSTNTRKRTHSQTDSDFAYASSPDTQRPLKRYRAITPLKGHAGTPSSFPSPTPSLVSYMPSPVAQYSSPEDNPTLLPVNGKRKRRNSDASGYDSDASRAPPTQRRRRAAEDEDQDTAQFIPDSTHAALVDPKALPSTSQTLKRKRRLSDAQDDRPRKHPNNIAIPRLHTVSNPLPAPSPFSDFDDIPVTLPLNISPAEDVNFSDMQNLDIEAFDYGSLPIMNEYLSQLEKSTKVPDYEEPFSLSIVGPEGQPFGPQNSGDDFFSLLDFNLPTSTELALPFSNDLFPGTEVAVPAVTPEVWSTNQLPASFPQTFEPTFTHNTGVLPTEPSGVNPLDLFLHSSADTQSTNGDNFTTPSNTFDLSWDPAFGASQTAMTLQKIQSLQAELEMCKTQLAQQAMYSF